MIVCTLRGKVTLGSREETEMSEESEKRQPPPSDSEPESRRGRHPIEDADPTPADAVPEDEDIVPGRHSAAAEAAWMRWRESHDE